MPNATAKINKGTVSLLAAEYAKRSVETLSAETTYYTGAFVGIDETGYYCKGDDSQAWLFAGLVRGREGNPVLPAGTAGDGTIDLDIYRPAFGEVALASVAVTDIGRPVYATFDNAVVLAFGSTTYANLVGYVIDKAATSIAIIAFCYDGYGGNRRLGAAKRLAATGAQTLSKYDMGKTIFCANTAALTVTLPAVADVAAGSGFTIVKDHASDTNIITLDGNASETIDGATTLTTIDAAYDCATLVSNGSAWVITSRDIA